MRHEAPSPSQRLTTYRAKRDFAHTPEPRAARAPRRGKQLAFVVQKHDATRLHYDFRLELDGVLLSWAVPKGPSYDPADKRMAVQTEDHPLAYADFEGTIPEGHYGAGEVIVWDRGHWEPIGDPHEGLARGKLGFRLHGEKLEGEWELVRMRGRGEGRPAAKPAWLLIKRRDAEARPHAEYDVVNARPDSVRSSTPPAAASASVATRPGATRLRISHPDRVIDPSTGLTKLDLVRYYDSVADRIVPHLQGRPVAQVRGPQGLGGQLFFQRHDPAAEDDEAPLKIASAAQLLAAAQLNVIEFHTGNAKLRAPDRPDRMVFDLDPGEGLAWPHMQEGAELVRALLRELSLEGWLKTSGGKGLHVVVPIAARWNADAVKAVSKAVVAHLAKTLPERFVVKSGPANRVGKIFVDYLRNGETATTVAAFSARARPGLGVSMPVHWDQLREIDSGAQWTVRTARDQLSFQKHDPWAGYGDARQSLTAAIKTLGLKFAPVAAGPARGRARKT